MGSSSSKAVRKLPTASTLRTAQGASAPSSARPSNPFPPPSSEADPLLEAPSYLEQVGGETRQGPGTGSGASSGPSTRDGAAFGRVRGEAGADDRGLGLARGGMGRVSFSGEKDSAITNDAMDPQFLNNLSRLGQVKIHDAGEFVQAQAQRTLLSRVPEYTTETPAPPANHLNVQLLVSLLDRLKTLPAGADPSAVYSEYGLERATVEDVRRWVNSVSVAETDDVRVEDGEEVREMKAVWIGGLDR